MKKNNNKGFTLVELLAVLLVMAILALIAVPMVVNIINKARKQAYQRSIEAYVRATELAMQEWQMDHPNGTAPTKLSDYTSAGYTIEVKGDKVTCDDDFSKSNNGGIKLTGCYTEKSIKKYPNLTYIYDGGKITEQTNQEETYEEYDVGDTFTFGGARYYVISESGINQDYVVALKDEPLSVEDVNRFGAGHINQYTGSNQGTAYNENGYGGMAYYTSSTCGWNGSDWIYDGCTSSYNASEVKYVVDAWAATLPKGVSEARLISIEDLINNLGYVREADATYMNLNSENTPSWVYNSNYWYWTMSSANDSASGVWNVHSNGNVHSDVSVDCGDGVVRPVINVLKSAISKN